MHVKSHANQAARRCMSGSAARLALDRMTWPLKVLKKGAREARGKRLLEGSGQKRNKSPRGVRSLRLPSTQRAGIHNEGRVMSTV